MEPYGHLGYLTVKYSQIKCCPFNFSKHGGGWQGGLWVGVSGRLTLSMFCLAQQLGSQAAHSYTS
jgi:hypothetical protein